MVIIVKSDWSIGCFGAAAPAAPAPAAADAADGTAAAAHRLFY